MENAHCNILVETALLGQGLPSISDAEILHRWPRKPHVCLVWMEMGRVIFGSPESFLPMRHRSDMRRILWSDMSAAQQDKATGFMTGSATMKVTDPTKAQAVVTAGMGGVRNGRADNDLLALSSTPITYVVTAPKDTMNLRDTIDYLRGHGVVTLGVRDDACKGFLFDSPAVKLDGMLQRSEYREHPATAGTVIMNTLERKSQLTDNSLLQAALVEAKHAEESGQLFLPAVNGALDRLTSGQASMIQLIALMENINLAVDLFTK